MNEKITIQIHNYDNAGRYIIVEDRKATSREVSEMKKEARASVRAEWDKLPTECRHILYYAELLDKNGNVWYAAIYMHGEAFTDGDFFGIVDRPDIGYVGAIHKKDLPPEFRK